MQKQSRRLTHLDSLRAIAALLVIWLHAAEIYHQVAPAIGNSWLHDVARHLDTGRIGVVLFFAISGFLIPTSLKDGPNAVRRFVVRRFFRLYPVFWLSIPLGYLTVWWPFGRRPADWSAPTEVVLPEVWFFSHWRTRECRRRSTSLKRSSRSFARSMSWYHKADRSPKPSARSA